MPKVNGEQSCEFCDHIFKWEGVLAQHISENIVVESITKGYKSVTPHYIKDKTAVSIKCRCPNCDKYLKFEKDLV